MVDKVENLVDIQTYPQFSLRCIKKHGHQQLITSNLNGLPLQKKKMYIFIDRVKPRMRSKFCENWQYSGLTTSSFKFLLITNVCA